jgi:oligoendopeptidase F
LERKEVPLKHKWKIEDIFTTDEEWERLYQKLSSTISFSKYAGKLGKKESLLSYLKENDSFAKGFEKLAVYSHMRHDEDSRVEKYNAYQAKIGMLYTKYSTEVSFVEPELASQSDEYLKSVIEDKDFSDYSYILKRVKDGKAHVLSKEQEELISQLGETFSTFQETYGMINNVDLPFPEIEMDGEKVTLSHGVYGIALHSSDRNLRKTAYEKYYGAYNSLLNTITSTYYGNVKKNVFLTKAYKYNSCLERALFEEDVDRKVYDNLLSAVNKNLGTMHRYIADRKKILGVDKLYFYDIYAPLVEGVEFKLSYEEAYQYVIKGLAPLGKDYQALLKKGYDERWLDVEETAGKRSGAYSTYCNGVHPYVLLNYQPTINEVFTIAHEMGHSIHSYFSAKNQPYAKSDYKIFVAEVASTVNEVLLLKYMLADAKDENLKKYLLNYHLDSIRATLHRQTMFAEFEYDVHTMVENDKPVTRDGLCSLYAELGKKYYGKDIEHDYNISLEWARIPHFYNAFYVYKYSTGITAAINIANRILAKEEDAVEDYFKFLSGGSSTDPVSLLKYAKVDLSEEKPFAVAMDEFEQTLNEFEKLMGI